MSKLFITFYVHAADTGSTSQPFLHGIYGPKEFSAKVFDPDGDFNNSLVLVKSSITHYETKMLHFGLKAITWKEQLFRTKCATFNQCTKVLPLCCSAFFFMLHKPKGVAMGGMLYGRVFLLAL